MKNKTYHRNIFQRIFGICATKQPQDEGCWCVENGKIIVNLSRATELEHRNGAIRLEGKELSNRVLVIKDNNDEYHAFSNHCTHMGRRLDPVPGAVQCCSIGKSTFDYGGKKISGSSKKDLTTYSVTIEGDKLLIEL
ncbi:MAG: Rieske (2Fe-2S) protein [Desulfobacterales bacterium]|nr:Rieske (2Fe-2S) protein [Desulfobacterales bacterium]